MFSIVGYNEFIIANKLCVFHYLTLLKGNKHELNLQQNLKLQSTQDIAN